MGPDKIPPLPLDPAISPSPPGAYADLPTVLPVESPRPGFWGAAAWCLAYLLVTQVAAGLLVAVGLIAVTLSRPGGMAFLENPEGEKQLKDDMMLPMMILAQVFSWAFSLQVIHWIVGRDWGRKLALRLPAWTQLGLVLLGMPGLIILANAIYVLAKHLLPGVEALGLPGIEEIAQMFDAWSWQVAVLVIGLGPGVGEELWCRGFLGRGLVGRYGVIAGVLLSSFFFGLIHLDLPQAIFAMVVGIALHYAYLTTRSLFVPMLVHFGNNSFSVIAPRIPELKQIDESKAFLAVPTLLAAAILVSAVGWALYRGRARLEHRYPELPAWQPDFPGVEYPPAGTGTVVVRPWPGWGPIAAVVGAVVLFGAALAVG